MADSTPAPDAGASRDPGTRSSDFAALLGRAQGGCERAWEELYRHYAGPVRAYVAMRGASDPDDLVGETFVQVARNLATFRGGEPELRSWIFMVAHNRVVDERRRLARRPALPVAEHDDAAAVHADVEDRVFDALGLDNVRALVERLTVEQRTVVLLRFVGDLTLEEIAAVTGRPLGAVKQLQRRALRSLKRSLVAVDVPR